MGQLWQGQIVWRILDTDFGSGKQFIERWLAWQRDPDRPRMLHYVALCETACSVADLKTLGQSKTEFLELTSTLAGLWWGLLPGFHRLSLDQGRVLLTMCVGPILPMLKAQQFEADELVFHPPATHDSDLPWLLKALARCCRRGTVVHREPVPLADKLASNEALTQALADTGFHLACDSNPELPFQPTDQMWRFDPPWQIKRSRQTAPSAPIPAGQCVVIGAGLAGASVAAALARRGWQVQVIDQADAPAFGASGLPVGLVVPHVSRDDCLLSRLSRSGARLMLQQASEMLLKGKDWGPSGVLERQIDGVPQLPPQWPDTGLTWSQEMPHAPMSNPSGSVGPGLWHPYGAWIKPTELVKAWLALPGITFQGGAKVASLHQRVGGWDLLDVTGECVTHAHQVVLANASGAFELLSELTQKAKTIQGLQPNLLKTQEMRGLLSWSDDASADQTTEGHGFPALPVNGYGSLIPAIPLGRGSAWFMGSSYQDAIEPERSDTDNHAINLAHLRKLLPDLATRLSLAFQSGQVKAWKGVRCVTVDRLPVVGPLQVNGQAGLWLCAGMGSRGLSFSALCAELLAARMGGEPLPVEAKLADALDGMRGRQTSS
ncbi:MAG: FAD-dependent 5-carboxymethylaminomethyl-2-thiouridine(34) oxidoreductase MnmC [Rhodoferax sp.]|nr:FAD-dependent 5-carboxymethylaminomethyl-2-thiouridine(34) oxidoreductase MnmC [Rhodoferax sp.]